MPRGTHPNSLANLKKGRKSYKKGDGRDEERERGGHNSQKTQKWNRNAKALVADLLSAEVSNEKVLKVLANFGIEAKNEKAVWFAACVANAIQAATVKGDVNALAKLAEMAGFYEENNGGKPPEININISPASPNDVENI